MFQPSPAARTTKRTAAKPTTKGKRPAKTSAVSSPAVPAPAYLPSQAPAVGLFVRRSAARIAAEIAEASVELGGFLLFCDGEDETGLHQIRGAMIDLQAAIRAVTRAATEVKVRGEAGHTDE